MKRRSLPETRPRNRGTAAPKRGRLGPPARRRGEAKRARILEVSMRQFAERGYEATRTEDIAREAGIAKGSVFQHFKTKDGLFLELFKHATSRLKKWPDAPPEVRDKGFFEVVRFWLERAEHLVHEDWAPFRVTILGNYGTDLPVRAKISRFLATEDPYETNAFVRQGIEQGELRSDIPPEMLVSMLEWMAERFQDTLVAEELDPGLFRRHGGRPQRAGARIDQFIEILRSAIGKR